MVVCVHHNNCCQFSVSTVYRSGALGSLVFSSAKET